MARKIGTLLGTLLDDALCTDHMFRHTTGGRQERARLQPAMTKYLPTEALSQDVTEYKD